MAEADPNRVSEPAAQGVDGEMVAISSSDSGDESDSSSYSSSRHAVFSPLVVDPVDAAIMRPQGLFRWCSYMRTAQSSLSEHLVTHIRSVISISAVT